MWATTDVLLEIVSRSPRRKSASGVAARMASIIAFVRESAHEEVENDVDMSVNGGPCFKAHQDREGVDLGEEGGDGSSNGHG